jgi:hypothetical protein
MGIGASCTRDDDARRLMRFAASEAAAPVIRASGLDPLFPEIPRGRWRRARGN